VNISKPFIERPVATTLLMAALFLIGVAAFPFLPIAPLPQIDFPTILVSAQLPGASPEIMASSVAQPLETQFAQISGISQMTSTSVLGSTQITLQFNLDRNIDAAGQDVQSAVDAAGGQLPKNLPAPPNLRKVNPADSAILILAVHSDVMPVTAVDDYAETVIAQQLSQLPGIAQVSVGGQQKPAVRVQIDPVKLAAVGLQLEDVANLITTASVDSPQGAITGAQKNFTIYDNDQLLKAAPWNDVVIAYRNGAPIRIRDVGVAVDGPENSQIRGFQNGKLGVLLLIYKQPGTNVIDAVNSVKAALPHVMTSVPPSLKVDQVIDRTTTIRRRALIADRHRAGGAGDLPVPQELLGHGHPGGDRAAVALGHGGAHVRHRLQPRQPVAHGAHHCGRLRGRRCDRDAGEHLPTHRGGHVSL
jgi:multidrug efflux pump subunit AcrB